tara:strand:+ start:727 stop:1056 length:330 start_codon:yes stop_codon:yes gene_type:complete
MNLIEKLDKLFDKKKQLIESANLCCDTIEFWGKKSDIIFQQMEDFEKEHIFGEEDFVEKKYLSLRSECEKLLKRINFENKELDKLESQTLEVEEKIINTLRDYAKKQKK